MDPYFISPDTETLLQSYLDQRSEIYSLITSAEAQLDFLRGELVLVDEVIETLEVSRLNSGVYVIPQGDASA